MCRIRMGNLLHHIGVSGITCLLILATGVACAQEADPTEEEIDENQPAITNNAQTPSQKGLRIENVTFAPRDANSATITFDINWAGSWRHGVFHDAAWVFFKTRADKPSVWKHVRLAADKVLNPTGYGQEKGGTPLEFVVPDGADGFTGVFLRRAKPGCGTLTAKGVTVLCEAQLLNTQIRAFGVEMVYVPEGSFFVGNGAEDPFPSPGIGTGGMEQNWLYQFTRRDGRDFISKFNYPGLGYMNVWAVIAPEERFPAYPVTHAGPIPTGRQKGCLWAIDIKPEDKGEIPATFPNGYAAFYCMKHPWITQGQYADFLNTLTSAQAKKHYWREGHGTAVSGNGTAIKRSGKSPDYTYAATQPDGMCPWIAWTDGTAFAAWAGLRPMTELEFEKSLRGPEFAVPNDTSTSYWGVNGMQAYHVYERAVSIGDAKGRAFTGTHGNGTLDLPADWPASYLEGVIFRGDYFLGSFAGPGKFQPTHMLVAGRTFPVYAHSDRSNDPYAGWRGARSAPAPAGSTIQGKVPGDTVMTPFSKPSVTNVHLARMQQPMRPDGVLAEWTGNPLLVLDEPSAIYPTFYRFFSGFVSDPWRGPEDMSIKAHLGWDGEALCVAIEVRDDVHCNTNSATSLWNGDSMQFGLIDADANQTSLWLALTTNGVVFNPLVDKKNNLSKTAQYAAVRDDAAKVTRYELRLPITDLGLKPGVPCCYYFMFFDNDGDGMRYRFQWAPIVTQPFKARLYSKFVLEE